MTAPLLDRRLLDRRLLDRRPWHEGETAARIEAGAPNIAPVIRTFLTDQHRDFFARLPLVFVAGLDAAGSPTASMLRGAPGFLSSPEPRRLEIAARFPAGETLVAEGGAPFGLIGIDFSARRRNRVNGRIVAAHGVGWTLAVDEAFGNCPKYIAPRELHPGGSDPGAWTRNRRRSTTPREPRSRGPRRSSSRPAARTAWTFPIAAGRPVSRASRLKAH